MATVAAASNTTANQTDDHPTKTADSIPATTTKINDVVSTEKPPVSSTDIKDGDTNLKSEDPEATNNSNTVDGDSVVQRKIRRAERFGMPVQLSEEEKRNSRAERFGTTPGSQGSDATKKAEELKRKARAERFGITKSTPAEEDEKKKARLSRFGSASSASVDPLEEEKKKARALRFSGTPVNVNGKLEPKATIAGKAGGEA